MKAYVIKNKEGKYWQENTRLFTELHLANFYKEKYFATKDAIYLSPDFDWEKNCEIVEITIAEGDLEQENKILKEALKLGAEKIEFMAQMLGQTLHYNVEKNLLEQAKESIDAKN